MNRLLLLLIFFIALSAPVCAQSCHCADEFLSLQRYMEKNYAGFKDKVVANNRISYDSTTAAAYHRARQTAKPLFCLALMRQWVNFFRDGHNYITLNRKLAPPQPTGEKIELSATKLAELEGRAASEHGVVSDIEGIYYSSDSTYKIAIIRSKTRDRDFAGVMLASRAPSWEPGQVKLELVQTSPTHFLTIMALLMNPMLRLSTPYSVPTRSCCGPCPTLSSIYGAMTAARISYTSP